MKYKFLFLTLLFGIICAEEPQKVQDAYRYFSVGAGPIIIMPDYYPVNVGFGFRKRWGKFGIDSSLNFATAFRIHQIQGALIGHMYFDSYKRTTPYLGVGLASSVVSNQTNFSVGPDFVIGKQLNTRGKRRHFIELHAQAPSWWHVDGKMESLYLPLIYIKYGISF